MINEIGGKWDVQLSFAGDDFGYSLPPRCAGVRSVACLPSESQAPPGRLLFLQGRGRKEVDCWYLGENEVLPQRSLSLTALQQPASSPAWQLPADWLIVQHGLDGAIWQAD